MSTAELDVVGVGNAIVDVVARTGEDFLSRHGLVKGAMRLIDEQEAHALYTAMAPAMETSGGSAANTMAGVASLGGKPAYIGRVRQDQLGEIFCHDLRSIGVQLAVPAAPDGPPTARWSRSISNGVTGRRCVRRSRFARVARHPQPHGWLAAGQPLGCAPCG